MRLRLVVAYVGTRYSGWQIQEKPKPPPTVQGMLEAVLRTLTGILVRVYGSGRTDAGVHAHGQVAHCDVPDATAAWDWRHRLNALLPQDIRILQAETVSPHFHARKQALHKTYVYDFWQERAFMPPRLAPFAWACGPLDAEAMRAVLPYIQGEHDFTSLRNAGTDVETSTRTVLSATLHSLPPDADYPPHAPHLRFTVTADGFLKQMVRNMAGLLRACGQGKLAPDAIPALLEARDRRAVPCMTAPAHGLTLLRVAYS